MRRWVPRLPDLAMAAGLTTATQVELWLLAPPGFPVAKVAAGLALGTAAVAWHRRAPLAALAVGLTGLAVWPGALGVEPAAFLGWFVTALVLMTSAGYHARRPAVAFAVALALLALGIVLEKGWVPADILFAWLLAGGAVAAGRVIASRTLRAELSEQRASAVEQQAQWRAAAAVAEERLRLARELHDVVSHGLSAMTLHVSGVRRLLRPDQEQERAALEVAERTGREALAEMHRMLGLLRTPLGEQPAAGLARLPVLVEPARVAGLEVELRVDGDVGCLPPAVDLAAFRIAQEALTNVLRHAGARRVLVAVRAAPTSVEVGVVDDGSGAPGARTGGHGIVGIRERAAALGGTVDAGPRAGGGWQVRAVLPVPVQRATAGADTGGRS